MAVPNRWLRPDPPEPASWPPESSNTSPTACSQHTRPRRLEVRGARARSDLSGVCQRRQGRPLDHHRASRWQHRHRQQLCGQERRLGKRFHIRLVGRVGRVTNRPYTERPTVLRHGCRGLISGHHEQSPTATIQCISRALGSTECAVAALCRPTSASYHPSPTRLAR